jgi:aminopeptidase-like protein
LSKNLDAMKKNIIAGFNITCVGDDRAYSYLPSRKGNTLADRVALNILSSKNIDFNKYSYLDRGSDERQYCSVGVDLPVASIMRSKYGTYPEYHTSLDNLDFISSIALGESYELFKNCLELIEKNHKYKVNCLGEPQLGRRGLYPEISIKGSATTTRNMMNFLAYTDGNNDLIDISNIIGVSVFELYSIIECLKLVELITE